MSDDTPINQRSDQLETLIAKSRQITIEFAKDRGWEDSLRDIAIQGNQLKIIDLFNNGEIEAAYRYVQSAEDANELNKVTNNNLEL